MAVNELSNLVWHTAPQNFGWSPPTAWYAIVILTIAGLITGLTIRFLPGTAGHLPVFGFAAGGSPTGKMLPALSSLRRRRWCWASCSVPRRRSSPSAAAW